MAALASQLILSNAVSVPAFGVCELGWSDVLDLLAAGLNAEQVIEEMRDLAMDDLKAALQYAASTRSSCARA